MSMGQPPLKIADHEAVMTATARLAEAQQQRATAKANLDRCREELQGLDEKALRLEALAELGEVKKADAKAARERLNGLEEGVKEAEREYKRKCYQVDHLEAVVADAEEEAARRIKDWAQAETAKRLKALNAALEQAAKANQEVIAFHDSLLAQRVKPPHPPLGWEDLREVFVPRGGLMPAGGVAHWEGLGAKAQRMSKYQLWLEDVRKHGYYL